jgi:hypothetical protein
MKRRKKKQTKSKESTSGGVERRDIVFVLYKVFNFLLPIVILFLIREGLTELAILLALSSKWRVFAVKPRHIISNVRSNATDIIVKVATVTFIIQAETFTEQLIWTAWYILWLTVIKPASSKTWVSLQAAAGHFLGVSAVFLLSNNLNDLIVLGLVWLVGISSARHFLSSYEETRVNLLANIWGLFVLQLAWVLNNWLLVYVFLPQLIFILVVVGYALASIYDAYKQETLKKSFVRQQAVMTILILMLIIALADWQGEI